MRELDGERLRASVSALTDAWIAASKMPCVAATVSQHGRVLVDICAGYSDPARQKPLRKDAIWRLASLTKPVTTVACLSGVERGWFSLDDRIADHIPAFADMAVGRVEKGKVLPDRKPKRDILLYQFLTHSSGFMSSSPLSVIQAAQMPASAYESNRAMVDYCLSNTCLTFEPGEAVGYSSYAAFDVIAVLIERYSGMPYERFLQENIFDPLGMKDTTYHPNAAQRSRMVTMCDRAGPGVLFGVDMGGHTFENFAPTYTCGGAGLVGTLADYRVFAEMLRRSGEYEGARILSPESVRRINQRYDSPSAERSDTDSYWGLGMRVRGERAVLPAGSYGWSGAYGTHFWVDPANDITAVLMKNMRWYDSHGGGVTSQEFEKAVADALT